VVTAHVLHREKYVDVGVPPGREFLFTRDGRPTEHRVRTLRELLEVLLAVPGLAKLETTSANGAPVHREELRRHLHARYVV
jgi:hypothetical protein